MRRSFREREDETNGPEPPMHHVYRSCNGVLRPVSIVERGCWFLVLKRSVRGEINNLKVKLKGASLQR